MPPTSSAPQPSQVVKQHHSIVLSFVLKAANTSNAHFLTSILKSSMLCLSISLQCVVAPALLLTSHLQEWWCNGCLLWVLWGAGITSLGFDHMELLGHTLDLIASEKAGIMRAEVPCFTVPQPPEAMQALQVHTRGGEGLTGGHSSCWDPPPSGRYASLEVAADACSNRSMMRIIVMQQSHQQLLPAGVSSEWFISDCFL